MRSLESIDPKTFLTPSCLMLLFAFAPALFAETPPDILSNSVGMSLKLVPPGSFTMGSGLGDADEVPVHKVSITKPFYMGVTEVTQTQWKAVMGDNPSHFEGDDRPVEQVSWNDASAFCRKLSEKEGATYRLPTEAEWEYACRAGTTTELYWGGDWNDALSWVGPPTAGETKPVGTKPANPWGLYDMIGNVWEWCEDAYAPYAPGDQVDPKPTEGPKRVCRGGGAYSVWRYARSAARGNGPPDDKDYHLGFRVVREE
ncbi:MAG: formylglycine-generating enzyme family protein [Planctomycetota bacterium]